jgi:hypothetical protein
MSPQLFEYFLPWQGLDALGKLIYQIEAAMELKYAANPTIKVVDACNTEELQPYLVPTAD